MREAEARIKGLEEAIAALFDADGRCRLDLKQHPNSADRLYNVWKGHSPDYEPSTRRAENVVVTRKAK